MVLGTYKEAVAARSTDKRIQEVAQDGGIASALLIYALENNIIEGAVVAGAEVSICSRRSIVKL